MNEPVGYLAEVFPGVQGEGPWMGKRQVFIRLAGCRLRCRYCDTVWARRPRPGTWRMWSPGAGWRTRRNPVAADHLTGVLERVVAAYGPVDGFAVTGGEPLEQSGFVRRLAGDVKASWPGANILLETNGLTPVERRVFGGRVDYVSMDCKLTARDAPARGWEPFRHILRRSAWSPGCLKVVVTPGTRIRAASAAARAASASAPDWTFVLQLAAGTDWRRPRARAAVEALGRACAAYRPDLRVLPQMHALLGWR